jgi:Na+-driven multidrug efflux pump
MHRKIDAKLAPPGRKRATVLLAVGGYLNTGILVVQGLLLVPLYLYYIGAHTYGLWLASGGILGMLALVNFGISSMMTQRVSCAYGQQNLLQTGKYFINGIAVYFCICLLFALIGWGVSNWIPEIFIVTGDEGELLRRCFLIAVLAMAIGIFNECLRSLAQALLRPVVPMISMAIGRILGIGGTIWMLFDDFGLWAIPLGTLLAEGVIFVLNLLNAITLFRKMGGQIRLDREIIKEYAHTSPALFTARIGTTLSQESEPLLITLFLGPEVTTAYMLTRRAADIVSQMLSVVYGATHSAFSNLVGIDSERAKKVASKLLAIVFSFGLIGFVSYAGANNSFVSIWVGQTFALDQGVILLIGAGFFVRSFRDMLWQLLNGWGDFIYSSYVVLSDGVLRLILMLLFLNILGVVGVPLALLLSCLGSGVLLWGRLRKYTSWENGSDMIFRQLVAVVALFSLSFLVAQFAPIPDSWTMFVLYLAMLVAAAFLLFVSINWRMWEKLVMEFRG